MKRAVAVLGALTAFTGCAAGSETFRGAATPTFRGDPTAEAALVSPKIEKAAAAGAKYHLTTAPVPTCEVRLFLEQLHESGLQTIKAGTVGAVLAEELGGNQIANGVCIKRPGQALMLPASMLVVTPKDGPDLQRFCRNKESDRYLLLPPTTPPAGAAAGASAPDTSIYVTGCDWNGRFHAARPFTITLLAAPGHAVGDYVDFLRVYRNGDLMAAWNRASGVPSENRVVIEGHSLVSGLFAPTHPPHLAAMDIRVIPRDDTIQRVVDVAARSDKNSFKKKLADAVDAAGKVALPPGSPERQSFDCLREYIVGSAQTISRAANGQQLPMLPSGCQILTGANPPNGIQAPTPLSDAYAQAKNQTVEQLEDLRDDAKATIARLKGEFLKSLPEARRQFITELLNEAYKKAKGTLPPAGDAAVTACVDEFMNQRPGASCKTALVALDPPTYAAFVQAAKVIDGDVQSVAQSADEAIALAKDLADRARDTLTDPNKQAEIFNAFAQNLATKGDTFEARRDNPSLLAGEQKIDMEYSDKFQGFVLAPWNGVPLRVNNGLESDFSAAVAVPLVDIGGVRYQWAKTRFADVRAAIGIGYIETEVLATGVKQAAALPNVSVGLSTLKVGLGIATGAGLGTERERLRLLVGADLFKLISGANVEVL